VDIKGMNWAQSSIRFPRAGVYVAG